MLRDFVLALTEQTVCLCAPEQEERLQNMATHLTKFQEYLNTLQQEVQVCRIARPADFAAR